MCLYECGISINTTMHPLNLALLYVPRLLTLYHKNDFRPYIQYGDYSDSVVGKIIHSPLSACHHLSPQIDEIL